MDLVSYVLVTDTVTGVPSATVTLPVSPVAYPPRTVMLIMRTVGPTGAGADAADALSAVSVTTLESGAVPTAGFRPQPPGSGINTADTRISSPRGRFTGEC